MIELEELEPLIALPSSPGNVVPVSEAAGVATRQVCVGSSVNSSFEDVAVVAAVLRRRTLPEQLDLTFTPGSRQILDLLVRSGVYSDALASGARILEPACGPCIGIGQAPAAGAVSVRTFNRNFPGRSGTPGDRVYLCSPATAAATALRGEITDPRHLGEPPELPSAPKPDPSVTDGQFIAPPEDGSGVELEKGTNIVPPPEVPPLPETIDGRVLIVVPDDVSTGDMTPDGALGVAIWSNIPACARYMFRRFDPDLRGPRRGVGRRHRRRRPQLRAGLEPGAGRLRGAPSRHPRRGGEELRPHPSLQPHRPGESSRSRSPTRRTTTGSSRARSGGSPSASKGSWRPRRRSGACRSSCD